ncbi:amyloid beta A4 precursor protein-binding family B member 1-interacting protein-like isoform X2 [Diorhabda sublineata]|uniref:amyloid beta A4 precursor protein-binding family B member 1-interacting protein-like isoform X2 n=1 Tax=Diorhabda sublineata TaxID=1163346 RepID=UPI0024E08A72|nr:amyloid beta A4 precursor protein-binding family B member 1-interacting protein-like isoform X2 [Diorhabda sublineata]
MYSLQGTTNFIKMNKFCESIDGGDVDSDTEDPEQLLNEWLGELDSLTGGLDPTNSASHLRPLNSDITAPRIDSYRFSMANLEDSQDVDLDAILGELCALETVCDREIGQARDKIQSAISDSQTQIENRTHNRSLSEASRMKIDNDDNLLMKSDSGRTESPDNDSAFSDTVSMLSSESSASSGGSGAKPQTLRLQNVQQDDASRLKAEKIKMAMEKIKEANIQKLFLKVFTVDGSAKSLLVDEKMVCSYVTRLLADKNHVQMEPKWAIVEHLPDLYMERFYEDHELLVDNLLLWTRDSKNKIYFVEREDKIKLFSQPERFLLSSTDKKEDQDYDEHFRNMLLEEYFSSNNPPEVEGPLYLKADSKKGWKKHHFVLRASGLYYYPKDKAKSAKDLVCLATFDNNHIYYGLGWKKKYKAPTDFCFAVKHPRLQEPKSTKYIKYLCAEDQNTLERWMVGMRIAKFGKQLMDNYRSLVDELAQEDLDILANARSCSVSSIAVQSFPSNVTTPTQGYQSSEAGYGTQSETYSTSTDMSSGRHSRASSSSSSGCMSDSAPSSCENAFDSEFPMGTIKRKPSMKPSLPLTNITRQLKEVGETRDETDGTPLPSSPIIYTNSGTLTRGHNRRKSNQSDDSSNSGTLKRQHSYKSRGSVESTGNRSGNTTPLCGTLPDYTTGNGYLSTVMTDSITSLPPPPPENHDDIIINNYSLPAPPPEVYNSNLSLDSLPPPPNPIDLPPITGAELTGSQLSLMSLPPPPGEDTAIRKRIGGALSPDLTPTHSRLNTPVCSPPQSNAGSGCSTPIQGNPPVNFNMAAHRCVNGQEMLYGTAGLRSSIRQSSSTSLPRQISCNSIASSNSSGSSSGNTYRNSPGIQRKVNFQEPPSPKKTGKKISFNLTPQEVPPLPKKPPPPKRAETTKLTSPKKLVEPPVEFLKDLQRVMRKKWQVAQKCKLEPETTPHEVLGFRDPPVLLPDYKEHNVSNWVQEHYGPNNVYENIYRDNNPDAVVEYATSPVHVRNEIRSSVSSMDSMKSKRPPPPPPPKRSETTHLTTPKTY